MQPLTALTLGIVSTSWECTQKVTPHLRPHPQDHALQHILIYCEFILFSFFLMSLSAFTCGLPATKYAKLKESTMLLIVHPTVDMYFSHLKDPLELERLLYEGLREGDTYYGCSQTHLVNSGKKYAESCVNVKCSVRSGHEYNLRMGRGDLFSGLCVRVRRRDAVAAMAFAVGHERPL
jgi:hypothetical protein